MSYTTELRNELKRRKIRSISAMEVDESLAQHIRRCDSGYDKPTYMVRLYPSDGGVRVAGSLLSDLHRTRNVGIFRNKARSHGWGIRYHDGGLSFQITPGYTSSDSLDAETVRDQLYEDYPNSEIRQLTNTIPPVEEGKYVAAATAGMFRGEYLPLKHIDIEGFTDDTGEFRDPYKSLLTKVTKDEDETVGIQVAFRPTRKGFLYRKLMSRAARKMAQTGTEWTLTGRKVESPPSDEDENAKYVIENQSGDMYEMELRVFAVSETPEGAASRVDAIISKLDEYYESHVQQGLYGIPVTGRSEMEDFFEKYAHCEADGGMKVMASELQGLAHFPEPHVNNPAILHSQAKSGSPVPPGAPRFDFGSIGLSDAAPDNVKQLVMIESANVGDPYWFGWGKRNGTEAGVYDRYLNAHQFVPGRTRMGKTVALTNFAGQAMRRWVGDEERESIIALLAESVENADEILDVNPDILSAGMTLTEVDEVTPDSDDSEGMNPARTSNPDREDSEGGLIIDPKGQDGDNFVAEWPKDRPEEDLIVVDLDDEGDCIPRFNMLEIPDHVEPNTRKFDSYTNAVADVATMMVAEAGGSDNYVGGVMKRVTRTLARGMLKSGRSCTFLDLAACASYQGDFEQFSDWMNEDRLGFIAKAAKRMSEDGNIDLNPLAGRFDEYVQPDSIRAMISAREPTFSIQDAVDEGKWVVLIFPEYAGETEVTALSNSYIAETYLAKMLSENDAPFHLIGDEVHNFTTDESMLPHILSQGGGLNYRCTLACQSPANQLPDDVRNAVQDNIDIWNTFKVPGNTSNYVASQYRDVDAGALEDVTRYSAYLVQYTDEDEDIGTLINAFPPIREVREEVLGDEARSQQEIDELKQRSMERYGEPMPTPEKQKADSPFYGGDDNVFNEDEGEIDLDDEASKREFLAVLFGLSLEQDAPEDPIPTDDLKRALNEDPSIDAENVHIDTLMQRAGQRDLIEVSPNGESVEIGEEGYVALWDSGQSGNSGTIKHQAPMEYIARGLSEIGYTTRVPRQTGEEMPDLYATLPVETGGDTFADAKEARDELRDDYPEIWALSGERDVAVEFEKATLSAPAQMAHNLRKAVTADDPDHVLFVVNEGEDEFTGLARKLYQQKLCEPMLTYADSRTPNDVYRRFNHQDDKLLAEQGGGPFVAVPGKESSYQWVDDSTPDESPNIVLRVSTDGGYDELARFESLEEWKNRTYRDFEITYAVNDDQVDVADGEPLVYRDEDSMREDYTPVYAPFIPEMQFGGELPGPDAWDIAVLPDDPDLPLQYYDTDEDTCYPLESIAGDDPLRSQSEPDDTSESDDSEDIWDDELFT